VGDSARVSVRGQLGLEGRAEIDVEGSGQWEDAATACWERVPTGFQAGRAWARVGHDRGLGRGPVTGGPCEAGAAGRRAVQCTRKAGHCGSDRVDRSDPVRIEKRISNID
jgi:hypothetical protein